MNHPSLKKPVRHIEKKYRDWIKTQTCLVKQRAADTSFCHGIVDPHHLIPLGGGKTGSKVSDRRCIPLCRHHHTIAPHIQRLAEYYEIDGEAEIAALNARYNREHPQHPSKVRVPRVQLCVKCSCKGIHPVRGGRYYCTRTRKYQEVA